MEKVSPHPPYNRRHPTSVLVDPVNAIRDQRVLVTGAAGFVGANLVRRLVRAEMRPAVLLRPGGNPWRLQEVLDRTEPIEADLTEPASLTALADWGPDLVFHLATHGMYPYQKDVTRTMRTNVEGPVNLLGAIPTSAYVLHVGSSSEYGVRDAPMKESDPLDPNNAYGVFKAAGTLYANLAARTRPVAAIRPFAVYGPWEDPGRLIPTLVTSCLQGQDPKLGNPDSVRDFVYVGDVVEAMLALSARRSRGIFNVGTGVQHTLAEVADAVIRITGADVTPRWGATARKGRVEPRCWRADIGRIEGELGWRPRHDLESGLTETVRWAQARREAS